ncbi:MAG: hypothetical protein HYZ75_14700 [Elusimicrobia bacterium]|nr:hypothetical protein [Elusimicrobiota bacterium]
MKLESPRPLPVLFEFPDEPERLECWGRFLSLDAAGAVLLCGPRVARGARLRLRFDLPGGERLEGLEGDARRVKRDADGYSEVRLLWRVCPARDALRRGLLGLFAAAV